MPTLTAPSANATPSVVVAFRRTHAPSFRSPELSVTAIVLPAFRLTPSLNSTCLQNHVGEDVGDADRVGDADVGSLDGDALEGSLVGAVVG